MKTIKDNKKKILPIKSTRMVNIVYKPAVARGDQFELEKVLAPVIRRKLDGGEVGKPTV
jgi:hypothetical protein